MKLTVKYSTIGLILLGYSYSIHAADEGGYVGIMAGLARNSGTAVSANLANTDTGLQQTVNVTPNKKMGAFRAYFGYLFNPWLGAEMGGTYYTVVNFNQSQINTNTTSKSGIATVDFLVVGAFTFRELIEVFGKAGAAVIYQGTSISIRPTSQNQSKYETYVKPTFSFGLGYYFNPSVKVDVTMTRLNGTHYLKNVNTLFLGVSYHFVNRYCGQFLCDD